jgi:hypothetical protein
MRRGGAVDLRRLINHQLGALDIARKIAEHTAPLIWAEVVGERIANATEVIGISRGVLRVSARSSSWAHELTFHRAQILDRLNRRLDAPAGAPIVLDIRFVNRGVAPKSTDPEPVDDPIESYSLDDTERAAIEASVAAIEDPGLRDRMRQARIRDQQLQHWRLAHGWLSCPRCHDLIPPWASGRSGNCPRCRLLP